MKIESGFCNVTAIIHGDAPEKVERRLQERGVNGSCR